MSDSRMSGWMKVVFRGVGFNAFLLVPLLIVQSTGGRSIAWPGLVVGAVLGVVRGACIRAAVGAAGPGLYASSGSKQALALYRETPMGRAVQQVSAYLLIAMTVFVVGAMAAMFANGLTPTLWLLVRSVVPAWFTMELVSWGMQLPVAHAGRTGEMGAAGH